MAALAISYAYLDSPVGRLLVAGIQHQQGWVVVGYLDDAPEKRGARVAGVPVIGTLEEAGRLAEMHGITHVIVAMPAATTAQRRRALDLAGKTGLAVLTVPSSQELLAGRAVNQVRDIEPEDLLGREPVDLDLLVEGDPSPFLTSLARKARFTPVVFSRVEPVTWRVAMGDWLIDVTSCPPGRIFDASSEP